MEESALTSMLSSLDPAQVVEVWRSRGSQIPKVNQEICDWFAERRKVEEAYAQGLKKLAARPLPSSNPELGLFAESWKNMVASVEDLAASHDYLAAQINKEIARDLRAFVASEEMLNSQLSLNSLLSWQKKLSEAQKESEKLAKKGAKANAEKVADAATRLESATSEWHTNSRSLFGKIQEWEEYRWNHYKGRLVQFQTDEGQCYQDYKSNIERTTNVLLEFDAKAQVIDWAEKVTAGKRQAERRVMGSLSGSRRTRDNSTAPSQPPPPTSYAPSVDDGAGDSLRRNHNGLADQSSSSRFNPKAFFNKRRQSISFGGSSTSAKAGFAQFGSRGNASRDGTSPRSSSTNLQGSANAHLFPLAESPSSPTSSTQTPGISAPEIPVPGNLAPINTPSNTNGTHVSETVFGSSNPYGNLTDLSDVSPPPGPPPSHGSSNVPPEAEHRRDSEGYMVRPMTLDPISQAEQDAADEAREQHIKLAIQEQPIREEDADAQAALSVVANTLRGNSSLAMPNRGTTIRGRRDVRKSVCIAPGAPASDTLSLNPYGVSPSLSGGGVTSQASDLSHASDALSIRSARSASGMPVFKHPDMHGLGLNASIVEMATNTFENGQHTGCVVRGEVAFSFNPDFTNLASASAETTIHLRNYDSLEAVAPDPTFIREISPDTSGVAYRLSLEAVMKAAPVPAFKYNVLVTPDNMSSFAPLLIRSAWKPTDDHKLTVVLEYKPNPAFAAAAALTLANLQLVATYAGPKASACQMKPQGTHVRDGRSVSWRLGDVAFAPGDTAWRKLLARFTGSGAGAELRPGAVRSSWEVAGAGSAVRVEEGVVDWKGKGREVEGNAEGNGADPFADGEGVGGTGAWVEVRTARKLGGFRCEAR